MPENLTWSHRTLIGGVIDPPFVTKDGQKIMAFRDLPPEEVEALNGTTLVNTSFYHHEPGGNPWPPGMKGVTFQECALTNCVRPPDCFLMGCDLFAIAAFVHDEKAPAEDWLVDDKGLPIKPLDEARFAKAYGLVKPTDLVPSVAALEA